MADEESSLLTAARSLAFNERVAHKNWKVRAEAFDDLKTTCGKVFSPDDPQLNSIGMQHNMQIIQQMADTQALS